MREHWRVRRGTRGDNYNACPPSDCMLLDVLGSDGHGACAYIVVRMDRENKDRPEMLKRADRIAAVPELEALLREMLYAFAPTVKSQFRLTQAQSSVSIHARELLERLKA